MSVNLLERIERDLDNIGELWDVDVLGSDLDRIWQKLSSLKTQFGVQKSLQDAVDLLRQQQDGMPLRDQRAMRVKRLIEFVFGKKIRKGFRHMQLRDLDCDVLKFLGLSYSIEEIVKMENAAFELLRTRVPEFFHCRKLSHLLYRPDIDKAVDATVNGDHDDDGSYENFFQDHTTARLESHKRKFDAVESDGASDEKAGPSQGQTPTGPDHTTTRLQRYKRKFDAVESDGAADERPRPSQEKEKAVESDGAADEKAGPSQEGEKTAELAKYGDVFILSLKDAQYALSLGEKVSEIFLTTPLTADECGKRPSFLTAWLTEDFGQSLSIRGQQLKL
ncbi:hypothetical protein QBC35DRAFT_506599 [Podospora australis]|uniref:Uncharacterized protein n=1 Tax=Podospora australis TaxID=1536484 RepID=A0AAN6WLN8_9PEZI|nr:hypothetical protein QBC35DRAFT_506599 [Podospora australis]